MSPKTAPKKNPKAQPPYTDRKARDAADLFKHVSDGTRLLVITLLAEGERNVGDLCEQVRLPQPAVSHHLALLRHGGIIVPRREGKSNFYGLTERGEQLAQIVRSVLA